MSLRVSIVTPCLNSARFIADTVDSVLDQTYPAIEYIVMDGGSTDETLSIVGHYLPRLKLISEPDKGQADAINKGWRLATGDIIAWLNADDAYLPGAVQSVVDYFEAHPDVQWLYGYARYLDGLGKPIAIYQPTLPWDYGKLLTIGCYIVQPTVFMRRQVLESCGELQIDLNYTMDYEYWLRIGRQYPGTLIDQYFAAVKLHADTKTANGGVRRVQELLRVVQSYEGIDYPKGVRYEWTSAYFDEFIRCLRASRWTAARTSLQYMVMYPSTLPRLVRNTGLHFLIPPKLENRLRQWLYQRYSSAGS